MLDRPEGAEPEPPSEPDAAAGSADCGPVVGRAGEERHEGRRQLVEGLVETASGLRDLGDLLAAARAVRRGAAGAAPDDEPPTDDASAARAVAKGEELVDRLDRAVQLAARTAEPEAQEMLHRVAAQVIALRGEVERLRVEVDAGRPVDPSALDVVCGTLVRLTLGAFLGAFIGGPAIAYFAHEPLIGNLVAGALGGLVGGAASELGRHATEGIDGTGADRGVLPLAPAAGFTPQAPQPPWGQGTTMNFVGVGESAIDRPGARGDERDGR